MLPRLRFVVASLLVAILPMLLLGSGVFHAPQATTALEIPRAGTLIALGPDQYSEAQYRQDRQALAYARRENELSRLREIASAPLEKWIAAPAGSGEADKTTHEPVAATLGVAILSPEKGESTPSAAVLNSVPATGISVATPPTSPTQLSAVAGSSVSLPQAALSSSETAPSQVSTPDMPKAIPPAPQSTEAPLPASTVPMLGPPPVDVALNAVDQTETLGSDPPPPGFLAPLPQARPKMVHRKNRTKRAVVRQVRPVKPAPAAPEKPFSGLFGGFQAPNPSTQRSVPAAQTVSNSTQTAVR